MTLTSINYKSKEENGKTYTMTEYTLGSHYTVARYTTKYESGAFLIRIEVRADYKERRDNYLPEIYYHDDFFGESKPRFEIQTTSYGALSAEEIKKVIAGYNEALEAVEILTKNFC